MPPSALSAFIEAATVPLDTGHDSGTLERADAILATDPAVATSSIHAAAILGDDLTIRRFLAQDAGSATATGGPRGWNALTHLCFSLYLRLDPSRSVRFVCAAEALLDAGADPNSGWYETNHQPAPEWESVLYGAAGVAHHPELTRLLLERGADPNDEETIYHTPEGYDNATLRVLVDHGRLSGESLALMLIRKHDWHDYDGVHYLLRHGANPNLRGRWGVTALHQAVLRDNAIELIELLLDHGADPTLTAEHPDRSAIAAGRKSAVELAARRGRGDLLALFERRGIPLALTGVDQLLATCARNDAPGVRAIAEREPALVEEIKQPGGQLLAEFAGVGNTDGVRHLLDLGVPVEALFRAGDGYWDVAPDSSALHVAAWRARHATVRLLINRGAPIDARDGKGRTPLALAVRACVDSYWADRRSPESVDALLRAGASTGSIVVPSGYDEIDALLQNHRY